MKIIEVNPQDYRRTFAHPQHVYNSVEFTQLNAHKVMTVHYVVLCDDGGKPRLGLTVGETADGGYRAPFSAPFSGFDFNKRQSATVMTEAAAALREVFPGLRLTLPPECYRSDINAATLLAARGCDIAYEWNHYFDLAADYDTLIDSAGRNKLRQSAKYPLQLLKINDNPLRAYEVIRLNREHRGYPLRMSAADVLATTGPKGCVKADFFVLTDGTTDAAAAMVYEVTPGCMQVIYWGDNPRCAHQHPMNRLACELFLHYKAAGARLLDIGPSSEDGVPSPGLCDFKESVGCSLAPKPILTF